MKRLANGGVVRTLGPPIALACLLLFVAATSCCLAQSSLAEAAAEDAAPAPGLPNFAARTVPGEAVVDLADFISGCLADSGTLPDFMQVQTSDGALRRISAAEAFILLARTAHLWQTLDALPATVPLAPDGVAPPLIDPEDLPDPEAEVQEGREISTDQFLEQCGPTVRWVDRLHTLPTAVTFDGERLSAAEYLAGLAICIQYAYWEGTLYDTVYLPRYDSPQSWVRLYVEQSGGALAASSEEEELWEEPPFEETGWEGAAEQEALLPVLSGETSAPLPPSSPAPELTLFPRSGSVVSGKVDLVAGYVGPPARFVTFAIDGATRAILNFPPYSYRWDTSALGRGPHTVRVQVLGEQGVVLTDQLCGYTVVPPAPRRSEEEFVDDL